MTRVLFVDDEPAVLNALRRSLRESDVAWQTDFVTSGEEALSRLASEPFEVIVTDWRMPGLCGEQLLQRATKEYPEIVQVILSGADERDIDVTALDGHPVFLAKPCPNHTLIEAISRAIFLKEFFRDGVFVKLVECFGTLSAIPEIQINIRPANQKEVDGPLAFAEVTCRELGIRLCVPLERSDRPADATREEIMS